VLTYAWLVVIMPPASGVKAIADYVGSLRSGRVAIVVLVLAARRAAPVGTDHGPWPYHTGFVVDGAPENGGMVSTERTYVTRYRFTRFVGTFVTFSAAIFVVGAVVFPWSVVSVKLVPVPTRSEWVLLAVVFVFVELTMVFFGAAMVSWLVASAQHWEAIRADSRGVSFARRPILGSRTVVMPWRDLDALVFFSVPVGRPYYGGLGVGLRQRRGAPRPAGYRDTNSRWTWLRELPLFGPPRPAGLGAYRIVRGFDLNVDEFVGVVREYAPQVEIVPTDDLDGPMYTVMVPK